MTRGDLGRVRCDWCGRTVALIRWKKGRVLSRHDNRNSSSFCKGSFMPVETADA